MNRTFELELEAYQKSLPILSDQMGKYALLKADRLVSVWDTYKDAIQEGYRQFGLNQFLVKRIEAREYIHRFSRDVVPACQS